MAFINDLSYAQATQIFLENATHLTANHQGLITSLETIARTLDKNPRLSASLVAEYTKIMRLLMKEQDASSGVDEIEAFLTRAG